MVVAAASAPVDDVSSSVHVSSKGKSVLSDDLPFSLGKPPFVSGALEVGVDSLSEVLGWLTRSLQAEHAEREALQLRVVEATRAAERACELAAQAALPAAKKTTSPEGEGNLSLEKKIEQLSNFARTSQKQQEQQLKSQWDRTRAAEEILGLKFDELRYGLAAKARAQDLDELRASMAGQMKELVRVETRFALQDSLARETEGLRKRLDATSQAMMERLDLYDERLKSMSGKDAMHDRMAFTPYVTATPESPREISGNNAPSVAATGASISGSVKPLEADPSASGANPTAQNQRSGSSPVVDPPAPGANPTAKTQSSGSSLVAGADPFGIDAKVKVLETRIQVLETNVETLEAQVAATPAAFVAGPGADSTVSLEARRVSGGLHGVALAAAPTQAETVAGPTATSAPLAATGTPAVPASALPTGSTPQVTSGGGGHCLASTVPSSPAIAFGVNANDGAVVSASPSAPATIAAQAKAQGGATSGNSSMPLQAPPRTVQDAEVCSEAWPSVVDNHDLDDDNGSLVAAIMDPSQLRNELIEYMDKQLQDLRQSIPPPADEAKHRDALAQLAEELREQMQIWLQEGLRDRGPGAGNTGSGRASGVGVIDGSFSGDKIASNSPSFAVAQIANGKATGANVGGRSADTGRNDIGTNQTMPPARGSGTRQDLQPVKGGSPASSVPGSVGDTSGDSQEPRGGSSAPVTSSSPPRGNSKVDRGGGATSGENAKLGKGSLQNVAGTEGRGEPLRTLSGTGASTAPVAGTVGAGSAGIPQAPAASRTRSGAAGGGAGATAVARIAAASPAAAIEGAAPAASEGVAVSAAAAGAGAVAAAAAAGAGAAAEVAVTEAPLPTQAHAARLAASDPVAVNTNEAAASIVAGVQLTRTQSKADSSRSSSKLHAAVEAAVDSAVNRLRDEVTNWVEVRLASASQQPSDGDSPRNVREGYCNNGASNAGLGNNAASSVIRGGNGAADTGGRSRMNDVGRVSGGGDGGATATCSPSANGNIADCDVRAPAATAGGACTSAANSPVRRPSGGSGSSRVGSNGKLLAAADNRGSGTSSGAGANGTGTKSTGGRGVAGGGVGSRMGSGAAPGGRTSSQDENNVAGVASGGTEANVAAIVNASTSDTTVRRGTSGNAASPVKKSDVTSQSSGSGLIGGGVSSGKPARMNVSAGATDGSPSSISAPMPAPRRGNQTPSVVVDPADANQIKAELMRWLEAQLDLIRVAMLQSSSESAGNVGGLVVSRTSSVAGASSVYIAAEPAVAGGCRGSGSTEAGGRDTGKRGHKAGDDAVAVGASLRGAAATTPKRQAPILGVHDDASAVCGSNSPSLPSDATAEDVRSLRSWFTAQLEELRSDMARNLEDFSVDLRYLRTQQLAASVQDDCGKPERARVATEDASTMSPGVDDETPTLSYLSGASEAPCRGGGESNSCSKPVGTGLAAEPAAAAAAAATALAAEIEAAEEVTEDGGASGSSAALPMMARRRPPRQPTQQRNPGGRGAGPSSSASSNVPEEQVAEHLAELRRGLLEDEEFLSEMIARAHALGGQFGGASSPSSPSGGGRGGGGAGDNQSSSPTSHGRSSGQAAQSGKSTKAIQKMNERIQAIEDAMGQQRQEAANGNMPAFEVGAELRRLKGRFDYLERIVPQDVRRALDMFEPLRDEQTVIGGEAQVAHAPSVTQAVGTAAVLRRVNELQDRQNSVSEEARDAADDGRREVLNVAHALRGVQRVGEMNTAKILDSERKVNTLQARLDATLPQVLHLIESIAERPGIGIDGNSSGATVSASAPLAASNSTLHSPTTQGSGGGRGAGRRRAAAVTSVSASSSASSPNSAAIAANVDCTNGDASEDTQAGASSANAKEREQRGLVHLRAVVADDAAMAERAQAPHPFVSQAGLRRAIEALQEDMRSWVEQVHSEMLEALRSKADGSQLQTIAVHLEHTEHQLPPMRRALQELAAIAPEPRADAAAISRSPLLPGTRCASCDTRVLATGEVVGTSGSTDNHGHSHSHARTSQPAVPNPPPMPQPRLITGKDVRTMGAGLPRNISLPSIRRP